MYIDPAGRTWTKPTATVLPNNNAGIAAFQLGSGATLLVFDKTTVSPRTPLVISEQCRGSMMHWF